MKNIMVYLMLALFFISGCSSSSQNQDNHENTILSLSKSMTIPDEECKERELNNKVILIESEYCYYCKEAKNILDEIAEEKDLEIKFLDVSKKEGMNEINNLKLAVRYTPTAIIGCEVVVGLMQKSEYESIISRNLADNDGQ